MAKSPTNQQLKRYAQLANCLNDTQTTNARIGVQQFIRQIKQLRQKLNMPATFSDYGLPKEEVQAAIPKIAEGALMDGLHQNKSCPTNSSQK